MKKVPFTEQGHKIELTKLEDRTRFGKRTAKITAAFWQAYNKETSKQNLETKEIQTTWI